MRGGDVWWAFLGGELDGVGRALGLVVLLVVLEEEEGGRGGALGGLGEEDEGLGVAELGRDSIVTARLFAGPPLVLEDAPPAVAVGLLAPPPSERLLVGERPRNIALLGRGLGWGRPLASLLFGGGFEFDALL